MSPVIDFIALDSKSDCPSDYQRVNGKFFGIKGYCHYKKDDRYTLAECESKNNDDQQWN
jgi:hypothetical protein